MNSEQVDIADNLRRVKERIRRAADKVGCDPDGIELVAVTKGFPADYILKAAAAGVRIIGENRAQEASTKHLEISSKIPKDLEWHFIGHLQTNKVKMVIGFSDLIHSLDRESLAVELDKRARDTGKIQRVLIEVNVAGEETKGGIAESGVDDLIGKLVAYKNVRVEGLMTMAPWGADAGSVRNVFSHLKRLYDKVIGKFDLDHFKTLSMGMTDDFEIAIEEGSNMVRIGRAIFGDRRTN